MSLRLCGNSRYGDYYEILEPLRPFDAEIVRNGIAYSMHEYRSDIIKRTTWALCDAYHAQMVIELISQVIWDSDIYLWQNDIFNAALTGAEIFTGSQWNGSLINKAEMWMLNEGCFGPEVDLRDIDIENESCKCKYILIIKAISTLGGQSYRLIRIFIPTKDNNDVLPYVRTSQAWLQGNRCEGPYEALVAAKEFQKQKFVVVENAHLPRPERRRRAKEGLAEPSIRVVTLRSRLPRPAGIDPGRAIEWRHQWIVSGHWRNQYHPSIDEHRPCYVNSYMKGPDGLPFLPPKRTIYAVNR